MVMHTRKAECQLFQIFRSQVRLYIMKLRAAGACNVLKPKPLQPAELRRCAAAANCGAITIMYGRLLAFIKMLNGPRNPVFVALRWGHVHFMPTYYIDKKTGMPKV